MGIYDGLPAGRLTLSGLSDEEQNRTAAALLAAATALGGNEVDAGPLPLLAQGTTTSRTLAARAGEVFNAKDHGATGDAVTDDAPAINAALRAADAYFSAIGTANAGRAVTLPAGTYVINSPLYLRKGDVLRGEGSTASCLKTGPDFPVGGVMVQLGFKSDGTLDPGGLQPMVDGIFFASDKASVVGVSTVAGLGPPTDSPVNYVAGWAVRGCWFMTPIGIRASGVDGAILGNCFDGCSEGVKLVGAGSPTGPGHSILIQGNRFFAPSYSGIHLDGAHNVIISGNYFDYCKFFGIYFANTQSGGSSDDITILGNHFLTSLSASFYDANQVDIDVSWPVNGLRVQGNTFTRSRLVSVRVAHSSAFNVSVEGNTFRETNSTAVRVTGQGNRTRVRGNRFVSPGNYALYATRGVDFSDNLATGLFAVVGLPVNDYQKSAAWFDGASGVIARGNSTDSTTCAACSFSGGGTGNSTSDNRSAWTTADVYAFTGTSAVHESSNERAFNGGGPQHAFYVVRPSGVRDFVGAGTPEAVVTAPIGSTYLNTSGGASTTLYVKTSGTGNTGWTAK